MCRFKLTKKRFGLNFAPEESIHFEAVKVTLAVGTNLSRKGPELVTDELLDFFLGNW